MKIFYLFPITANEHRPWELYQKVFFSLPEKSRHPVKPVVWGCMDQDGPCLNPFVIRNNKPRAE
jgi:hypothetical protein